MLLYFESPKRQVAIDTKRENYWFDFNKKDHRIIHISEDDMDNLMDEIDFNAWNFSGHFIGFMISMGKE